MSLAADRVPCQRSNVAAGVRSNLDAFVADFELSGLVVDPLSDVTELLDCNDTTLVVLLDKHAPWCLKIPKAR